MGAKLCALIIRTGISCKSLWLRRATKQIKGLNGTAWLRICMKWALTAVKKLLNGKNSPLEAKKNNAEL